MFSIRHLPAFGLRQDMVRRADHHLYWIRLGLIVTQYWLDHSYLTKLLVSAVFLRRLGRVGSYPFLIGLTSLTCGYLIIIKSISLYSSSFLGILNLSEATFYTMSDDNTRRHWHGTSGDRYEHHNVWMNGGAKSPTTRAPWAMPLGMENTTRRVCHVFRLFNLFSVLYNANISYNLCPIALSYTIPLSYHD